MSAGNLNLTLTLTGRDNGARNLMRETERSLERTRQAQQRLAREQRPYALAGIRSERQIRREITQTQAAYNRLARSGRASHNDLARAAAATRQRIAELNAELNRGLQAQGRFGRALGRIGRIGAPVAAGSVAAYAALKPAMDNQLQLQSNLNQVARNAFVADKDKSPRWIATEGKAQVRALAEEWVKQSGGNADAAIGFINAQLAQGLDFAEIRADKGRGYAGMTAMAQNGEYDYDGTASLYAVFKNAGLKGDAVTRAVEKTIQSGLDGKFEIADVVREAPALLSGMGKAGMTADKDLDYLLAWMQSAANKAGSNSEAANNLSNLISKSASVDLAKKVKKELGFNWEKEKLAGIGRGENAVQVLARLINSKLDTDKQYQAYLDRAKKGDANAANQAESYRMGLAARTAGDIQAGAGLVAAMDTAQMQKYMAATQGTDNNKIDRINAVRMMDNGAIQEQNKALALLRQDKMMNPLNDLETKFSGLVAEFPNAAAALQALTAAVTAATAAMAGMALLGLGGRLGGVATTAGGAAAGGMLGRAWGSLRGLGSAAANGARAAGGWAWSGVRTAGGWLADGAKSAVRVAAANPRAFGAAGALLYSPKLGDGNLPQLSAEERKRLPNTISFASKGAGNPAAQPEKLAPVITQQTQAYQNALTAQTGSFQAALQADTAAVGGKLDAINGTLGGLNQTIQNNISLNVDGRVIANEVSRHQVAMFGRGAGQ